MYPKHFEIGNYALVLRERVGWMVDALRWRSQVRIPVFLFFNEKISKKLVFGDCSTLTIDIRYYKDFKSKQDDFLGKLKFVWKHAWAIVLRLIITCLNAPIHDIISKIFDLSKLQFLIRNCEDWRRSHAAMPRKECFVLSVICKQD